MVIALVAFKGDEEDDLNERRTLRWDPFSGLTTFLVEILRVLHVVEGPAESL
jgi:hypothetical protein